MKDLRPICLEEVSMLETDLCGVGFVSKLLAHAIQVVFVKVDPDRVLNTDESIERCEQKIANAAGWFNDRSGPKPFPREQFADLSGQGRRCLEITELSPSGFLGSVGHGL